MGEVIKGELSQEPEKLSGLGSPKLVGGLIRVRSQVGKYKLGR